MAVCGCDVEAMGVVALIDDVHFLWIMAAAAARVHVGLLTSHKWLGGSSSLPGNITAELGWRGPNGDQGMRRQAVRTLQSVCINNAISHVLPLQSNSIPPLDVKTVAGNICQTVSISTSVNNFSWVNINWADIHCSPLSICICREDWRGRPGAISVSSLTNGVEGHADTSARGLLQPLSHQGVNRAKCIYGIWDSLTAYLLPDLTLEQRNLTFLELPMKWRSAVYQMYNPQLYRFIHINQQTISISWRKSWRLQGSSSVYFLLAENKCHIIFIPVISIPAHCEFGRPETQSHANFTVI